MPMDNELNLLKWLLKERVSVYFQGWAYIFDTLYEHPVGLADIYPTKTIPGINW